MAAPAATRRSVFGSGDPAAAASFAKSADVAIVFADQWTTEECAAVLAQRRGTA